MLLWHVLIQRIKLIDAAFLKNSVFFIDISLISAFRSKMKSFLLFFHTISIRPQTVFKLRTFPFDCLFSCIIYGIKNKLIQLFFCKCQSFIMLEMSRVFVLILSSQNISLRVRKVERHSTWRSLYTCDVMLDQALNDF